MISRNKIEYDFKKAIKRDGKIAGWKLYVKNGLGGHFVGYLWRGVSNK